MWENPPQGYFHHPKRMTQTGTVFQKTASMLRAENTEKKVTVTAEQNDNENIRTLHIALSEMLQSSVALQPVEVKKAYLNQLREGGQ